MVVGLLGNKSAYSNILTLVFQSLENGVRLQDKLGSKKTMGLPVGVFSINVYEKLNVIVIFIASKYFDINGMKIIERAYKELTRKAMDKI